MLDDCLDLLLSQDLLVLATASQGVPHTSLMAYVAAPDGREVLMATLPGTRKWANLAANPEVSLLVDDRRAAAGIPSLRALTVAGTFVPAQGDEERALLRRLAAARPQLEAIASAPQARAIRVRVRTFQLQDGPLAGRVLRL